MLLKARWLQNGETAWDGAFAQQSGHPWHGQGTSARRFLVFDPELQSLRVADCHGIVVSMSRYLALARSLSRRAGLVSQELETSAAGQVIPAGSREVTNTKRGKAGRIRSCREGFPCERAVTVKVVHFDLAQRSKIRNTVMHPQFLMSLLRQCRGKSSHDLLAHSRA